jgi:hypothetical protein
MRLIFVCVLLGGLICHAGDSNRPITLRYIKTGHFNNSGYGSFGTILWATNHTTNTLAVTLSAVEAKAGSNWIARPSPVQPLSFQPPGKPFAEHLLPPHGAGYATIQLPNQPTGTTWRVKVAVQPVLTGFADMTARVKRYPDLLQRRLQTGNTNIPVNPFKTNMVFFGKPTDVISQEIPDER